MKQCIVNESDFESTLAGQLVLVQRNRTECSGLRERAAALRLEKLQLEKALEKQESDHQALSRHGANLRSENMSSFLQQRDLKRMAQSENISLMDDFLRLRAQLYKVKTQLEEEKARFNVQQPMLESLDFEVQSKLDGLIEKNMASLNQEQDEWSEALRKMADYSTGIVLGRADIEQKCSKVEEITRVLEEKVWQRQASSVAVTHHGRQQLDSPDCLGSGEQDQRRGENNDKSCQEKVVENIRVKEMEMENMMEALARIKKMVSELRTCHVSCVIHQEEMELKTEVKEVEEMWKREKAELEDGLDGEIKQVALIARELEEN